MYEIDPNRTDLAREFRARPFGVHSPELQSVLNRMRSAPGASKYIVLCDKSDQEWTLAVLTGEPQRVEPVVGHVFRSLEDAEWVVFKLRWKILTGQDLEIE